MSEVVAVVRLLLAGVFVVSAVAKLRDRAGSRTGVEAFGVPAALVTAVAAGLPLVELACAVLLVLPDPFATVGAVGSLVMLLAFTAAIVVNLVQGRHPECHCFGSMGDQGGIGWSSVARNGVLTVLAALSLVGAGSLRFVPAVLADLTAAQGAVLVGFALLAAAVLVLAAALRTLLARYGEVLLRLEALEEATGTAQPKPAPDFTLPDLDGHSVALTDVVTDERPALLAFISPTCHNCTDLIPDLAAWQAQADLPFEVVVVSDGSVADIRAKISEAGDLRVLRQKDFTLASSYGVEGTPAAVVVGTDLRLAGPPAYSPDGVRELQQSLLATMTGSTSASTHQHLHSIEPRPLVAGDPAPETSLLSEQGAQLSVTEVSEDAVVMLFWRTDCGFCQGILDDVRQLEQSTPVRLVTDSDPAEIRASGLTSPILRDPGSALERWLQVPGTPSAARLLHGALDSDVAVGGPDVMGLIRTSASLRPSGTRPA